MSGKTMWRLWGVILFSVGCFGIFLSFVDMIKPGLEIRSLAKASALICASIYCEVRSRV